MGASLICWRRLRRNVPNYVFHSQEGMTWFKSVHTHVSNIHILEMRGLEDFFFWYLEITRSPFISIFLADIATSILSCLYFSFSFLENVILKIHAVCVVSLDLINVYASGQKMLQ